MNEPASRRSPTTGVILVTAGTLILVALTFLPMLALGPLAEGIH